MLKFNFPIHNRTVKTNFTVPTTNWRRITKNIILSFRNLTFQLAQCIHFYQIGFSKRLVTSVIILFRHCVYDVGFIDKSMCVRKKLNIYVIIEWLKLSHGCRNLFFGKLNEMNVLSYKKLVKMSIKSINLHGTHFFKHRNIKNFCFYIEIICECFIYDGYLKTDAIWN